MTTEPEWYLRVIDRIDKAGLSVPVGQWQSQDIRHRLEMVSVEVVGESLKLPVPKTVKEAQSYYNPNLPWAEDHFQERVSGQPLNPPPSEEWWPFAQSGNRGHKEGEVFSHTYPERIWPRFACIGETRPNGRQVFVPHNGIRYEYGDLDEVVTQLTKNVLTRQAYLPIWFPEDTGAIDRRVPCTLGYHFLFRRDPQTQELQGLITYYIRSCDALRHLKDDAYMAARLLQWVVGMLEGNGIQCTPKALLMHISSLHFFEGDRPIVANLLKAHTEEDMFGHGV